VLGPRGHRLLDRDVVVACERPAAETAEHDALLVGDDADVPVGLPYTRSYVLQSLRRRASRNVRANVIGGARAGGTFER
jgi:hypothetical protein